MDTKVVISVLLSVLAAGSIESEAFHVPSHKTVRAPVDALSPEDYFISLVDQFDDAVRSYGIYNLPIHDYTVDLDATYYGVHLDGQCAYTFGYVSSMDPFLMGADSLGQTVTYGDGYLKGFIDLPNIEVIYDFQATLTVGDVSGTATLRFPNNRISVWIQRNTTVQESLPEVSLYILNVSAANHTVYVPETNVTNALARDARLHSGFEFWDDITAWNSETFLSLLQGIVDSMEFPV